MRLVNVPLLLQNYRTWFYLRMILFVIIGSTRDVPNATESNKDTRRVGANACDVPGCKSIIKLINKNKCAHKFVFWSNPCVTNGNILDNLKSM